MLFGVFQRIAPLTTSMPGEFAPTGYLTWLRTWVDDVRYTEKFDWPLDIRPIKAEQMPSSAFDTPEERDRVAALLDQYNNPPGYQKPPPPPREDKTASTDPQPSPQPSDKDKTASADDQTDNEQNGNTDEAEQDQQEHNEPGDEEPPEDENARPGSVLMTPELDAEFAQIAAEKISRHSFRFYVVMPLRRAASMWFDNHSQYYPFQGALLPLKDLDKDLHQ